MRKDDKYNKTLLNAIISGTPIPAKKAKEIAQRKPDTAIVHKVVSIYPPSIMERWCSVSRCQ